MFQRLTDANDPSDLGTFDVFLAAFAGGIDGLWASRMNEVGIVAGVTSYALAARAFRDGNDGNERGAIAFSDYARQHLGGFWTNKRMPAATNSNIQAAILYRMGRAGIRKAVCPHWGYAGPPWGRRAVRRRGEGAGAQDFLIAFLR